MIAVVVEDTLNDDLGELFQVQSGIESVITIAPFLPALLHRLEAI